MIMAASGFQHLTLDERRSLFRTQEARLGVTEMAARLAWQRSTIYGELGRNRFRDPDASWDNGDQDLSGIRVRLHDEVFQGATRAWYIDRECGRTNPARAWGQATRT